MSLPKRLAHYIINGLLLRTNDFQNEIDRLKEELEATKCVSCKMTFVGYESELIMWCDLCQRGICEDCPKHYNTYNSDVLCDNHPEICKKCFDEPTIKDECGVCGITLCHDHQTETFDCNVCKKRRKSCRDDDKHILKRVRGICKCCDVLP